MCWLPTTYKARPLRLTRRSTRSDNVKQQSFDTVLLEGFKQHVCLYFMISVETRLSGFQLGLRSTPQLRRSADDCVCSLPGTACSLTHTVDALEHEHLQISKYTLGVRALCAIRTMSEVRRVRRMVLSRLSSTIRFQSRSRRT